MKSAVDKINNGDMVKKRSLLDSPHEETQVKENPRKIILRVLIISFLFVFLTISCVLNFTTNVYSDNLKYHIISTFNTDNFYKTKACDLIIVKSYKSISDARVGDEVYFLTNSEQGSGKVVDISSEIFELKQNDGSIKRVSSRFVVGKMHKKIAVLGFFVAVLESYYGIAIFTIALLVYTAYITFSRINYENTEQGKKLYKRYKKTLSEEKERQRLLEQLKNNEHIGLVIASILNGDYKDNKLQFYNFNFDTRGSLKEKYKYILHEVHNAYLTKEDLTRNEKRQITGLIELMFDADGFDSDMEYMLIDLILKTSLYDFEMDEFKVNAIDFIESTDHKSYLLNLASVLYVLVYKNTKLRDENMVEVLNHLNKKIKEMGENEQDSTINVAESILKLIKS